MNVEFRKVSCALGVLVQEVGIREVHIQEVGIREVHIQEVGIREVGIS